MAQGAARDRQQIGVIHLHSDYSHDGRDSLEDLRVWAAKQEIRFVALSDHAEDLDPDVFRRYLEHCHRLSDAEVTLIPGLEYRFEGLTGLHLLALGLRRWLVPATPAEFIAQTRGNCELTVLAHPVLAGYRIPEEVLGGIDAVEVWNAAYNTRFLPDPRAIRLLHAARDARPAVVGTAGLDQHDRRNDRQTRISLVAGARDPLAEIRAGRFRNHGRTLSFDSEVSWGAARMAALTLVRWGYDRVERVQDRVARARQAAERGRGG